jgi:hypothetical protein
VDHVSELLSPYLDGQVTPDQRAAVEAHLGECGACREELASLRALTRLLGQLPVAPPPRSFAIGPRPVRPAALSGTLAGFARAATSIAAALAVLALSGSLIFQGLPHVSNGGAAAESQPLAAPALSPPAQAQPGAQAAARAASAPGPVSAARAPAAAAVPSTSAASSPLSALAPASAQPRALAPAAGEQPSAAASAGGPGPAADGQATRAAGGVNIPRLAGELIVLIACVGVVIRSLRWWRA